MLCSTLEKRFLWSLEVGVKGTPGTAGMGRNKMDGVDYDVMCRQIGGQRLFCNFVKWHVYFYLCILFFPFFFLSFFAMVSRGMQ